MSELVTSSAAEVVPSRGNCRLVSSDNETFEIPIEVAEFSGLIKTMIAEQEGETNPELPLPKVNGVILSKMIAFLTHYKEEPMDEIDRPIRSSKMTEVVQEYYAKFVETEGEHLFNLTLAANYMDVQPVIDLICASVAAMVKDKTKEELYAAFGITTDFTPEEEVKIREENKWAEERGY